MNVTKCPNNHYYDQDVYTTGCPHCASGLEPFADSDMDEVSLQFVSIYAETEKERKKRLKLEKKQAKQEMKDAKKQKEQKSVPEQPIQDIQPVLENTPTPEAPPATEEPIFVQSGRTEIIHTPAPADSNSSDETNDSKTVSPYGNK